HRQRAGPPPRGPLSRTAVQRRRAVRSAEASCRGQRLCLRARSGHACDPACVEYGRGRRETVRGAEGGALVTRIARLPLRSQSPHAAIDPKPNSEIGKTCANVAPIPVLT